MKKESIEKSTYRAILREVLLNCIEMFNPKAYFRHKGIQARAYMIEDNVMFLYYILTLLDPFIIKDKKITGKVELSKYKGKNDLLGVIAGCEDLIVEWYAPALRYIISFFESIDNYTIRTNHLLPRNLRKDFEEMFMLTLYLFIKSGEVPSLEEEILQFKFEHSKLQNSNIPPSEALIEHARKYNPSRSQQRVVIFYENMEIDNKKAKYISKIISSRMAQVYISYISFKNCHITGKFDFKGTSYTSVRFNRCKIDTDIKFPEFNKGPIIFNESVVSRKIILDSSFHQYGLEILDCHFLSTSSLSMKQLTFVPKASGFTIKNSVFSGNIILLNVDALNAKTELSDIRIDGNISLQNLYLNSKSVVNRISSKGSNNVLSQLKKCFFESDEINKRSQKTSGEDGGKAIQLQTNWLPPKAAAKYISKSVIFLAKMRANDKIQPKKNSIPYVGEKKSIVYPKEALDAYLMKDYQKLQTLREKYNFIKK